MTTAIGIKCCACGAESIPGHETCDQCGSGELLDRKRYLRRAFAVSIMVFAIALLVAALVYGELHRAAGVVALGI